MPRRRPFDCAVSPATALPSESASSRLNPSRSATVVAQSVKTGARLIRIFCAVMENRVVNSGVKGLASRPWRVLSGQKILNALDQLGYALRFREHSIDSKEGCQLPVDFFGIHGHHDDPNPRLCAA